MNKKDGLKLFTFYLLNDSKSENTIMLLKFLNSNINAINKKGIKVKFNLVNKDEINTKEFMDFIKTKNINNIPCIINETDNEVISGMENILQILNVLTNAANITNGNSANEEDEEEKYNSFMQNYMFTEMTKPDEDDRFDDEDTKKDLGDKLRALEKQRKNGNNINLKTKTNIMSNINNNNNNNNNYQNIDDEDDYAKRIANKINYNNKRDIDQDSLTKKLLDKLEES
jgi:hypothetical protein